MSLTYFGWNDGFARVFAPYRNEGFAAGRITLEQKNVYMVACEAHGEIPALATGIMLYDALSREALPVVGDWVVIRVLGKEAPSATIHAILPRASLFSRNAAGARDTVQPVAANIDIACVLTGLDDNFNLRRIERYLLQIRASHARPVVLLTKADLCAESDRYCRAVRAVAGDAGVHAISTMTGAGLAELHQYLQPGITAALLGSSGVGKSTLLNHLLGAEVMRTQQVRADDSRGRHTTTHRQLFMLPSGAMLIDTPGMRALQLWGAEDDVSTAFPDIVALSAHCRFDDCRHEREPACAVRSAIISGELDPARFANYQKMQRELQHLAARTDRQVEQAIKLKWKQIHKLGKEIKKQRGR